MENFINELQFLPKVSFVAMNSAGDAIAASSHIQDAEQSADDK